jgi:hypothetical protein
MDHEEAVRPQAAEKYVLGELAEELCEAYEEHISIAKSARPR